MTAFGPFCLRVLIKMELKSTFSGLFVLDILVLFILKEKKKLLLLS